MNKRFVFCNVGWLKQTTDDKLTNEYYSHIAVSDQSRSLLANSHLRLGCFVRLAVMLLQNHQISGEMLLDRKPIIRKKKQNQALALT